MDFQSDWTVLSLMFTFKQQSFLVGPSLAIVLITVRMVAAVCSASTIGKKSCEKKTIYIEGVNSCTSNTGSNYTECGLHITSRVCSINLNET